VLLVLNGFVAAVVFVVECPLLLDANKLAMASEKSVAFSTPSPFVAAEKWVTQMGLEGEATTAAASSLSSSNVFSLPLIEAKADDEGTDDVRTGGSGGVDRLVVVGDVDCGGTVEVAVVDRELFKERVSLSPPFINKSERGRWRQWLKHTTDTRKNKWV